MFYFFINFINSILERCGYDTNKIYLDDEPKYFQDNHQQITLSKKQTTIFNTILSLLELIRSNLNLIGLL